MLVIGKMEESGTGFYEHRFGMWLCYGGSFEGEHKVIVQRRKMKSDYYGLECV